MDLIEEFELPSNGEIYSRPVTPTGRIRAPRLVDKGIGELSSKNKIQAGVLNKTILEPGIGIDAYQLHTSDFTYLNLVQRMAARGKDMKLILTCPTCKHTQEEDVDLSTLKITKPKLPLDLKYTTKEGVELELNFFTPKILDDIKAKIAKYQESYPEADHDIGLQETCRALIKTIDGEEKSYSKITSFLLDSYEVDLVSIVDKSMATNFGPVLIQKRKCGKCGEEIIFSVSPDRG